PPALVEHRRRSPYRPSSRTPSGRVIESKTAVHVMDLAAEPAYTEYREPAVVAAVELGGIRTYIAVPLLKENELIGIFTVYRQEVRPFTDKQIELVKNFAAQAVIAIENTRLLGELRDSLQQKTPSADVLRVISSSSGTLDQVFSTMLAKATELCDASYGAMWLCDGDAFRTAAFHGD